MKTEGATQQTPIFFIGFPRSGTTLISEAFFHHEAVGWPSLYSELLPTWLWPNVIRRILDNRTVHLSGRKGSIRSKTVLGNRFLPQPAEAYRFWDMYAAPDFSRSCLRDRVAHAEAIVRTRDAVKKLLWWQGRSRFAAKLTGPPRLTFLNSIFPDAQFIHIVRDGRAAISSLLNVAFWREKGGLDGPFWDGVLLSDDINLWKSQGKEAGILAALQWRRILEATRREASAIHADRYLEIRYEDFVEAAHASLTKAFEFTGLNDSERAHRSIGDGRKLANLNKGYRSEFEEGYIETLTAIMRPALASFGYCPEDDERDMQA